MNLKSKLLATSIVGILLLSACGSKETNNEQESDEPSGNGEIDYSEAVDYTITGIEPGAGISVTTEKAIEEYENLAGWSVELSSTAAMMAELDKAISNEEPIIVTGWNPHWMFAKYPDLKYLEDPKGIYGGEEGIHTIVRHGLEEEKPEAYKILSQFEWDVEDMEEIMFEAEETGVEVEDIAQRWVENNEEKVAAWLDGVDDVDGIDVELILTPWDSERASAGVLKAAMEQKGFNVTTTPVDVAIMFESVANGDGDASVAAWLPQTHKEFYERYQDDLIDLGPNLIGAKIGLAVPGYMNIDSIEELEPKN